MNSSTLLAKNPYDGKEIRDEDFRQLPGESCADYEKRYILLATARRPGSLVGVLVGHRGIVGSTPDILNV